MTVFLLVDDFKRLLPVDQNKQKSALHRGILGTTKPLFLWATRKNNYSDDDNDGNNNENNIAL